MVVYGGVLDDRHLRATIRTALRAHGFTVSRVGFDRAAEERWRLGCWLRDQAFRERFPDFADVADYLAIAEVDPYLWNHLPLMAGLGFQQARVLHGLAPVSREVDAAVAWLGAAFNTAIAVLDYLVDERREGPRIFALLSRDAVRHIFEPTSDSAAALAGAYKGTPDPSVRLLLTLVGTCAAAGRELHRRSRNDRAWAGLAHVVVRLYEAERAVSLLPSASREEVGSLLPALETKSVFLSQAMLEISTVAAERPPEAPPRSQRASATLGRVFWRVDELVDLLTDCRRGAPSALVLRLADRLVEQGRTRTSDADVYDVVDATASELVTLLEPRSFGLHRPGRFEEPAADPTSGAAAEGAADVALAAVVDFAHVMVAEWVGWREDPHPEAGPSAAGQLMDVSMVGSRSALAATELLLAQQRDGYREAIHHLHFPRAAMNYETHPALLSHRAVALDGLLDAHAAGLPVPRPVLDAEAIAILRAKHRAVRGGWSYIPEVPELPPDADDLGQVLQVLYRLGGPALAATCDEGIRLALDAAEPDGGFNTWILDPRGRSPADEAIRAYLGVMGGWGVHPEVVANLLYGLILYDPLRYSVPLHVATGYLEAVQDERGAWASKWYDGPYYGTYRVVVVLGFLTPGSATLGRARAFLLDNQRADGSWGDGGGDPLATALALLALATPGLQPDQSAIERGAAYLVGTQHADGGWPSCPWISFPTTDGMVTHGSRTITTTFCLKALLARPAALGPQTSEAHE